MKLYTIGFTQKTAEEFFRLLRDAGVERVVDVRVHPEGQLAGFAKKGDLAFFLKALNDCDYVYLPELAPQAEAMKAYRKTGDWEQYAADYNALLDARDIPAALDRALFEDKVCCLLCSEPTADTCHRRLAAERLQAAWGDVEVTHL